MKKKYVPKIGDRVRVVECGYGNPIHEGVIGKIKDIDSSDFPYHVVFEDSSCAAISVKPLPKKKVVKKAPKMKECKHEWLWTGEGYNEKDQYRILKDKFVCTKCLEVRYV